MKRRIGIILFLFITGITGISAQEKLTVEEAIATTLANNYDIRLSKLDSTSYGIDESYIYTFFLPTLNGNVSRTFNRNTETNKFKGMPGRTDTSGISKSNNWVAGVGMNWVLFDGFLMFATRDHVKELVKMGSLGIKTQIANSIADVVRTYYDIVQQKQQLNAIIEQKSISEERVKLADKKLSVGLGAKPELLQAKVDLNAFISSQHRQNTVILQLKEQLNQLMGVSKGINYDVLDTIPIKQDLTLDNILTNIDQTNPDLQIFKKNIDISKIVLREVKSGYYPKISLVSNYNFNMVNNTQNINPFQLPYRQVSGLSAGLTATVPIFNGFNVTRQVKQAKLSILQQEVQYDNQILQVDVAVKNAFKDYELQKQNLLLEEDNILLAKENVNIALERFKQGVSTYIELRDAQISLVEAYNRLIAARYNAKVAEIQLMRLKGEIIR
ncbi:TolC family protein [Flavihumibacter profundi]|jgi:outer membrane protein|uniref:TolC family protein n=1 Tax=Flavihumibacter profundi TaxID=2716883 RepID=UPI001CC45484|nr:TolC family protein [Flavihumibacter profundi]MBZ5855868.1 TolC family protein [Flavihumibacter profundi]